MTKNAPELRFKGFTDDWEQRKVFELGEIITGNTPSTGNKDYYKGQYLFVSPADIQDNRYVSKTNTTLTELGFKTGRFIRKGSTLFVSIGSTIGKVGQADRDLITNQQINSIIPSNDYDDNFVYSILLGKSAKIKQLAATQAVPIINKTEFGKTIINVPSFEEQIKIGTFFKQLDDTIALHQRKLDLLKQLKQAYLQKLFPKKEEDRPEIRYTEFKENWKQRKFDDIVIRVNKSSNSDRLPKVEFEDIFAGEGSLNKDISKKFDTRKGIEFESEDILYGKLRPYLKNWLMPNFKGVALGDFWIFRVKSNIPSFVYSLIQADKFQKAANDTSGTKMPRPDWKKVSNTIFLIPENLEEQKKIGIFFKLLDDTIALHQKKLDQLKHLKSAFLQKMFI